MNHLLPDPLRWKDERAQASAAERAAGETLRSLPQPEPLTSVQLTRIAARVRATQPRRRYRLVFVTLSLLFGVATAASAAHLDILPTWIPGVGPKAVTSVPHDAPKVRAPRKGRPTAMGDLPVANESAPAAPLAPALPSPPIPAIDPRTSVEGSAPVPPLAAPSARKPAPKLPAAKPLAPSPAPAVFLAPAPATAAVETEPPAPAPAPEPTRLAPPPTVVSQEVTVPEQAAGKSAQALAWSGSPPPTLAAPVAPNPEPAKVATPPAEAKRTSGAAKHFAETLRVLRVQHDAKTALAMLDSHGTELSQNALGHEALLLRVEALLTLGRDAEVLRLLDGAALTDVAASHSLLVTRGRLRAAANRCVDGVGDFGLVLAESRQPDRQALFGRALCRKQLGDPAGARADLERYRREFPADPRLRELERRLGSQP
jgi:hypothetical protein